MKKVLSILFVGILAIGQVYGQQNLFNIPSGDITPKGKVFYQHQLNFYSNKFESKGHFVAGLGKNWDGGVNLVGTGSYFRPNWRSVHNSDFSAGKALSPTLLATLQKQWTIKSKWTLNVGTQSGINLSTESDKIQPAYLHYGLVGYQIKPGRRLLVGPYVTNQQYVGAGNTVGIHAGYEWKLNKNLYLMGDFISGNNDSAVLVSGLMYNVGKRVQLCLGYMVPNPNTIKNQGLVFEFNWYGWDFH